MISDATRAHILALAKKRMPPRHIKAALHGRIPISRIYDVLRQAKRAGEKVPDFRIERRRRGHKCPLTREIADVLVPYARARGCSVTHLAKLILEKVSTDGIVDAVLDDQVSSDRRVLARGG